MPEDYILGGLVQSGWVCQKGDNLNGHNVSSTTK